MRHGIRKYFIFRQTVNSMHSIITYTITQMKMSIQRFATLNNRMTKSTSNQQKKNACRLFTRSGSNIDSSRFYLKEMKN